MASAAAVAHESKCYRRNPSGNTYGVQAMSRGLGRVQNGCLRAIWL